jgi:hypothetical protein
MFEKERNNTRDLLLVEEASLYLALVVLRKWLPELPVIFLKAGEP